MKTNESNKLTPSQSELGKSTKYDLAYTKDILFPIAREFRRQEIGIDADHIPFFGADIWNHYEVSWLNEKGKPVVALAEIVFDCASPNIIESKSMKLYFNSLNHQHFKNVDDVAQTIQSDLIQKSGASSLTVKLVPLSAFRNETLYGRLEGFCLDELDIECQVYQTNPDFLSVENEIEDNEIVEETLFSNLLKSNCLVTNQPDWCSIQIQYRGKKINHEGLLRYIVSFRETNEFHEHCIEKIFMHIMKKCEPEYLMVYGRSTRRGGIDINAYRCTHHLNSIPPNHRLCRQ